MTSKSIRCQMRKVIKAISIRAVLIICAILINTAIVQLYAIYSPIMALITIIEIIYITASVIDLFETYEELYYALVNALHREQILKEME